MAHGLRADFDQLSSVLDRFEQRGQRVAAQRRWSKPGAVADEPEGEAVAARRGDRPPACGGRARSASACPFSLKHTPRYGRAVANRERFKRLTAVAWDTPRGESRFSNSGTEISLIPGQGDPSVFGSAVQAVFPSQAKIHAIAGGVARGLRLNTASKPSSTNCLRTR